jgi:phage protein|nr:MAG TPA: type I neck protein [Caudoviricetes sp.]
MSVNGSCNFRDWEQLKDSLQATEEQLNLFIESLAKEIAARLLRKVIKRTPVGQYPKKSGKKGGTLRRGWTTGKNQADFINSIQVHHIGDKYQIEIENPTEYASYVEFGHRKKGGKGWVKGKFMLTISEQEIESAAPKIIENKIKKMLGDCFR